MLSKSEILVLISNSGLRQQLTALEQKMGLVRDTEAAVLAKLKQQEPVEISDGMAYAFHGAMGDGSLTHDEVDEIKRGLAAAFANFSAPVQKITHVSKGWQCVPIEPTLQMINAPSNAWPADAKVTYAAMLNAAPLAPVQQVGINGLTEAETDASASVSGLTAPVQQETANPFVVFQIIQERNEARDMIRKVEELNAELEEVNQELLDALKEVWLWMENQADAQSKGGHATFDMMMLREHRDIARAAIAAVERK